MKHAFSVVLIVLTSCVATSARAQASDCGFINSIVLEGKAQSLSVLGSVRNPLACIVPQIPEFELELRDPNPNPEAIEAYLSLTAAAILLVESDFENVTRFRALDNINVAKTLAAGSGHPDRSVRLNSARLLASIVDNTSLCVVLDQLHQPVTPEEGDVSVNARANLLGVARAAASWIGEENQYALSETLAYTVRSITQEDSIDLSKTQALVSDIGSRLLSNSNGAVSEIELKECRDPLLYEYWTPLNYEAPGAEMNVNPFLQQFPMGNEQPIGGELRFCYQEFRGDDGNDSFLVSCHTSLALCERAKINPRTISSDCIELDMNDAPWTPNPRGLFGSLFQYSPTQVPPPFPQVPL